jgi:glycosyltransferase involved in cell wall biosynthesis
MILIFYFFAAVLILLSYKSFRGGMAYLRFFKSELARPHSGYNPFVTVIAPCRGLDEGVEHNLQALVEQEYSEYEVIFVVADKDDPAIAVISGLLNRGKGQISTRLIVAQKAINSGQKVENLREAVLHANERSQGFVFVDSDARPSPNWLSSLVSPLADEAVGAATGYRWFISKRQNFGSEMRSAWNASIASALGPNVRSNFCWGGSTAIRRDTFERLDIREKWRGTLSDDFTVTRAMNKAGLPIIFVPQALTASIEDCSFGEMLEFTTRQMKITRVYAPPLWLMSLFGSALFSGVMISSILVVILSRQNGIPVYAALFTLGLVTFFSVGKSWLRLSAVRLVLPDHKTNLDRQFVTQNTLWLLTPGVFLLNSLAALFSRRLTWRGITYELKSPGETVIIAD